MMAEVRIHDHEESGEALPRLCMRCGTPATHTVPASFSWVTPWVYFLLCCGPIPLLVAMLFARKSSKIIVPLCDRHVNHWRYRQMFVGAGVIGVIALFLGLLSQADKWDAETYNAAAIAAAVAVIVWLVTAGVLQHRAIRSTRITDTWTNLTNVDQGFADALKQIRDASGRLPTPTGRTKPS
jgi:hypothetical protein